MNKLFGQIGTAAAAVAQPAAASRDNPPTIVDGSENATRRQLVQVLLRDVLRRSGIPAPWIDCQMLLVSSRTKGAGMYVRLVIKHWNQDLMNYANAFQKELLHDIEQFDPQSTTWLHGISWTLEVGNSCPFTSLPEADFWKDAEKPQRLEKTWEPRGAAQIAPAETTASNDPADDLEKLFAIRDQDLARQAEEGLTPVGYEKTQPSPLA
ncbi:MAG: hypothetical protein V4772_15000 [Pseudomonadota bacterium]